MSCEDIPSLLDIQNTKKHIDDFGRLMGTGEGDSTNEVTGQVRPTYNKVMKSVGFKPGSGDFTTGFTVMPGERDIAWYDPVSQNWYSYLGVIPSPSGHPVAPGTNPVGDVNWSPRTDQLLRNELSGDNGFGTVFFKPAALSGAIKRSLEDWANDGLTVNVKWLGAKGDWDMGPAQTGTDDTAAIAKAVAFLATLGSRRNGAVRRLYFPQGAYRYDTIALGVGIKFGLECVGDGRFATYLCANQSNSSPAIDSQIELIEFKDMTLMGSLSDAVAGKPAQWKDVGFKGKNFYNIPDIDVKFTNCELLFFKDVAHIYGRGCAFDNCAIGEVNCLLNIVCDPATTFVAGDALRSVEVGMRNYAIRNCRTDQVRESLVKVTGTGPQKEYINGLAIRNNDFVGTVLLTDAPDATLRRLSVGGNTGLYSFRFGVVKAKGATSVDIIGNNLSRRYEETVAPSGFNDAIPFLINTTGELRDTNVSDNIVRNLSSSPVATAGVASNITVKDNTFPNGWTYFESGSNLCHIFYATSNCPGLHIDGNQFISTVTSRTYRAFNPAAQTDKNTFVGVNPAPWSWVDSRLEYTPSLLVNGVATSVTPSSRSGRYHYDGKYVHVEVMLIVAMTETTGALAISLPPITAIAENPGITGSYAGGGEVNSYLGFSVAGSVFSRIIVNPVTQRAELWRENGMGRTQVGAGDKTGAISLYVSFKYRA